MNIAVTGGLGRIGKVLVGDLLAAGHTITILDAKTPDREDLATFRATPALRYQRTDILRLGDLASAFRGQDAVVHLAAIIHPHADPPREVFEVDVMGTFNVLEAAACTGVPKVVYASSDAPLGFVFSVHKMSPEYLPIDEEHPLRPQDCYSLAKLVGEEICKQYSRRYGMSTICIRVAYVGDQREINEHRDWVENPDFGSKGLWIYTDVRDASQAFKLAVEAQGIDHDAFYTVAADARSLLPSRELVERYYPGVPVRSDRVEGDNWSFITCAKAEKMLGYKAKYSWRDYYQPQE